VRSLMVLGGADGAITTLRAARRIGLHTICVDQRTDAPAVRSALNCHISTGRGPTVGASPGGAIWSGHFTGERRQSADPVRGARDSGCGAVSRKRPWGRRSTRGSSVPSAIVSSRRAPGSCRAGSRAWTPPA
jgi:hypothetical protein